MFKITSGGALTVLHSFTPATDGGTPYGSLVQATDGNFCGVGYLGGTSNHGTIFRITPGGLELAPPSPHPLWMRSSVDGQQRDSGQLGLVPGRHGQAASVGKNSQPLDLAASAYNSSAGAALAQTFQWQTEPVGNDSSNPSGSLNLLFGSGSNVPTETDRRSCIT